MLHNSQLLKDLKNDEGNTQGLCSERNEEAPELQRLPVCTIQTLTLHQPQTEVLQRQMTDLGTRCFSRAG